MHDCLSPKPLSGLCWIVIRTKPFLSSAMLTLCMLGIFSAVIGGGGGVVLNNFFSKHSLRNIISMSNSLDPDLFVRPDLGLKCLQRL